MTALLDHRILGSGPPLVLLTGYGATTGHWPDALLDPLARHRRLVLVSNPDDVPGDGPAGEGCGATARRVAALLDALDLARVDVVGWSMGGMVAQALAADRPDLVGALVLAASAPGDGTALDPAPASLAALSSGRPDAMLEVLFPGDAAAAAAYRADVAGHPDLTPVPLAVVVAQGSATRAWRRGKDPAGHRAARITVPTLVVQGTRDELCPPANAERLGELLHADVDLVDGAGHGVLFTDPAARAERILAALVPGVTPGR